MRDVGIVDDDLIAGHLILQPAVNQASVRKHRAMRLRLAAEFERARQREAKKQRIVPRPRQVQDVIFLSQPDRINGSLRGKEQRLAAARNPVFQSIPEENVRLGRGSILQRRRRQSNPQKLPDHGCRLSVSFPLHGFDDLNADRPQRFTQRRRSNDKRHRVDRVDLFVGRLFSAAEFFREGVEFRQKLRCVTSRIDQPGEQQQRLRIRHIVLGECFEFGDQSWQTTNFFRRDDQQPPTAEQSSNPVNFGDGERAVARTFAERPCKVFRRRVLRNERRQQPNRGPVLCRQRPFSPPFKLLDRIPLRKRSKHAGGRRSEMLVLQKQDPRWLTGRLAKQTHRRFELSGMQLCKALRRECPSGSKLCRRCIRRCLLSETQGRQNGQQCKNENSHYREPRGQSK